ncbi:MAG: hypothetical protein ACRD0O_15625, partial [Acidimicrobiia bacterium]
VWAHRHLESTLRRAHVGALAPLLTVIGGACLLGGAANAPRVSTATNLSQWLAAVSIGAMAAGTVAVLVVSAGLLRRLQLSPVPPPGRPRVRPDGQLVRGAGR